MANISPGDSVVVLGCSGMGLLAIQGAAARKAGQIIAVDRIPSELERAHLFGATDTIEAGEPELVRVVRKRTERRGADVVIDATGSISAMEMMIGMTWRGGHCVFVGMPGVDEHLSIPVMRALIASQRTFSGCVYGAIDIQTDVPAIIARYQAGDLMLDELVTHTFCLDEVNSALQALAKGRTSDGPLSSSEVLGAVPIAPQKTQLDCLGLWAPGGRFHTLGRTSQPLLDITSSAEVAHIIGTSK